MKGLQLLLASTGETEAEFIRLLGHQLIAISYGARPPNIADRLRVSTRSHPLPLAAVRRAV